MLELWEDFRVTPVWGICLGMKHHLKLHSKETWRINWIIALLERQTNMFEKVFKFKPETPHRCFVTDYWHLSLFAALWGLLWSVLTRKCWQELWKALQLPAIRWHWVSNWVLRAGGQVTESPNTACMDFEQSDIRDPSCRSRWLLLAKTEGWTPHQLLVTLWYIYKSLFFNPQFS